MMSQPERAACLRRVAVRREAIEHRTRGLIPVLCLAAIAACGCGYAGTPPDESGIRVAVTPASATVLLGGTQQFQAIVTGSPDTNVTWEVNGVAGGNAATGTIAGTGLYTAPSVLPTPANVRVRGVSEADPQMSGSATVNLESSVAITVSPSTASVPSSGAQVFTASVSGTTNTGVTWSVNGIAGGNSTIGTIAGTGTATATYAAPSAPPSPATVTVTATSTEDTSKSGSASVTITCSASNAISPSSASVALGQTQSFSASFCLAAGQSIAWDVNGIAGGNSTLGTITSSGPTSALYTAPAGLPSPNPVTVHAVESPQPSGGPESAAATVTITGDGITVSVSPLTATLAASQHATFTATVANTPDTTVTWAVNGILNGNATVGQICLNGTGACVAPSAPLSGSMYYFAPASIPGAGSVTLTAASHADPSRNASATIFFLGSPGGVRVAVSPAYAFIDPSTGTPSTTQFAAQVTGSGNTHVTWSVQGGVSGEGCAGTACGSVTASGLYTAPSAAPSPNAISVIATSEADPTKFASAAISISSGPAIEAILPSSTMAGDVEAFPLAVRGVNFVAGSGSSASAILINGVARGTSCSSAASCVTALNPTDVQSAGTLTVQVRNPGTPGALSNPVPFVIVPFNVSKDTISLSSGTPTADGEDIVVVDPTTAAASSPINVDFIGLLTGGNTCGVQGSPLAVARPASGTATVSICVHGNGLDPTFLYAFTGPSGAPGGADIGVAASAVTGLFSGTIELDLQLASSTLPGVRSLVITTLNNDRAVATGMLEVK